MMFLSGRLTSPPLRAHASARLGVVLATRRSVPPFVLVVPSLRHAVRSRRLEAQQPRHIVEGEHKQRTRCRLRRTLSLSFNPCGTSHVARLLHSPKRARPTDIRASEATAQQTKTNGKIMHTTTSKNNKNQTASGRSSQLQQLQGKTPTPMSQVILAAKALQRFISPAELEVLGNACRGQERDFFKAKMVEMADIIDTMPCTYETDGMGDQAIVWLHYFTPSSDFYIVERDQEDEQLQAFGLACLYEDELGYINIAELIACGAELDLYWEPKTISQIKTERQLQDVNYPGHPMHY